MQPEPVRSQVTAVLAEPVTVALNCCVPAVETEALVGLRDRSTATAATIVTLAEADLVGSAMLVACTVTVKGEVTELGGV